MSNISKYVIWTHVYSPFVCMVKDSRSSYFGKFWILTDNENINGQYLSFDELVKFWDENPNWKEEVVKPRLDFFTDY